MKIAELDWPESEAAAVAEQERLRGSVILEDRGGEPGLVAGLDVAYADDLVAAAVTVLDARTLAVVESAVAVERPAFPYIPGLFAFREIPALVSALRKLEHEPDLLVCDGHGLAHPRRFGLACHLGVLLGVPAMGVGKTFLVGEHVEPARERGSWTPLVHDGETVGRTVRTRDGIKPVYVSAGHLVSLETATRRVLELTPAFRLPETTRTADGLSRRALAAATS
ncbi:endonuclease V [Actinocorallia lasiicapitis]